MKISKHLINRKEPVKHLRNLGCLVPILTVIVLITITGALTALQVSPDIIGFIKIIILFIPLIIGLYYVVVIFTEIINNGLNEFAIELIKGFFVYIFITYLIVVILSAIIATLSGL